MDTRRHTQSDETAGCSTTDDEGNGVTELGDEKVAMTLQQEEEDPSAVGTINKDPPTIVNMKTYQDTAVIISAKVQENGSRDCSDDETTKTAESRPIDNATERQDSIIRLSSSASKADASADDAADSVEQRKIRASLASKRKKVNKSTTRDKNVRLPTSIGTTDGSSVDAARSVTQKKKRVGSAFKRKKMNQASTRNKDGAVGYQNRKRQEGVISQRQSGTTPGFLLRDQEAESFVPDHGDSAPVSDENGVEDVAPSYVISGTVTTTTVPTTEQNGGHDDAAATDSKACDATTTTIVPLEKFNIEEGEDGDSPFGNEVKAKEEDEASTETEAEADENVIGHDGDGDHIFKSQNQSVDEIGSHAAPLNNSDRIDQNGDERESHAATRRNADQEDQDDDESGSHAASLRNADQQKELLALPRHKGSLSDRYYITGQQYWLYSSEDCTSRLCVCIHCGSVRKFSNVESLARSISHISLHLTRECPACPVQVKDDLGKAYQVKAIAPLSPAKFAIEVFKRSPRKFDPSAIPTRPINANKMGKGSTTQKTKGKTGTSTPTRVKTKRVQSTPERRALSATEGHRAQRKGLIGSEGGTQDGNTTQNPGNVGLSERPRRSAATVALAGLLEGVKAEYDYDEESLHHDDEQSRPIDVKTTSEIAKALPRVLSDEEGKDPWSFCEDGSVPLLVVYQTVAKYGRAAFKENFLARNKPHRISRITRIFNCIEESLKRGYDLFALTQVLERLRGRKSLYTFADDVPDTVAKAERIINDSETPIISSHRVLVGPKLQIETDPNPHYIEEMAFLFHDPKTREECWNIHEEPCDDLKPLPPAEDLQVDLKDKDSEFARSLSIKWHYDEEQRVLLLNFGGLTYAQLSQYDLAFFACMLECDHVTVISEGLLNTEALDSELWDFNTIERTAGDRSHHKFKRFVKNQDNPALFVETDHMLEGRIGTYMEYLNRREKFQSKKHDIDSSDLDFRGPGGTRVQIDAQCDVIYMIDFDLPRILPRHSDDFTENFKLSEILPGGKWCMMNSLPKSARPFMGPNLYVTPGGAYTHFHQDGNGTVDSGHCCLAGYNEVVMLRRLPERHKAEASRLLPNRGVYDALYRFPHENGQKPDWPTFDTIKAWKDMGYYPSVFILKPGQHVHINKGRLHAFRKLTTEKLPDMDCHSILRKNLIVEHNIHNAPVCVSVAWDWQFTGINSDGINKEVASSLECQLLVDQRPDLKCLAIPKACLLALGHNCRALQAKDKFSIISKPETAVGKHQIMPAKKLLSGIAPSLIYVLEQNISFIAMAHRKIYDERSNLDGRINIAPFSDSSLNPLSSTVDPDGNDYFCKLCSKELENVYLHCDGCEDLLQRDFNICMNCYESGQWRDTVDMHGRGFHQPADRTSCVNHTGGHFPRQGSSACHCVPGLPCLLCKLCNACSCTCHRSFTLRNRFYGREELVNLLEWLKSDAVEQIEYGKYTKARLQVAADRRGKGYEAKRSLYAENPVLFARNTAAALQLQSRNSIQEQPSLALSAAATTAIASVADTSVQVQGIEDDKDETGEKNDGVCGSTEGSSSSCCVTEVEKVLNVRKIERFSSENNENESSTLSGSENNENESSTLSGTKGNYKDNQRIPDEKKRKLDHCSSKNYEKEAPKIDGDVGKHQDSSADEKRRKLELLSSENKEVTTPKIEGKMGMHHDNLRCKNEMKRKQDELHCKNDEIETPKIECEVGENGRGVDPCSDVGRIYDSSCDESSDDGRGGAFLSRSEILRREQQLREKDAQDDSIYVENEHIDSGATMFV
ncbi:hypothetical protein ACA910_013969 [Epithemia clementina (nom. ined.)]